MMQDTHRCFRLVCSPEQVPQVEALLAAQGFVYEQEPFSPWARRLVHEPFPLGSSLAAHFGYVYIQNRSSMLPPLVLQPKTGDAVLDMCASPGSKTGFLGQMVGLSGFVLGNEPSRNRLQTLRRNLVSMNLLQCATSSYPGEHLPLPGPPGGGWNSIQLDPPCSGWGTVEKNPQVLQLWQGDKVKPLIALQRQLLRKACSLLRPGGLLVYSTCTTNTAENEEQLDFAVDELGLIHVPVDAPPGFVCAPPASARFAGSLRVETSPTDQGFFVALLQKPFSQHPGNGAAEAMSGMPEHGFLRSGAASPDAPEREAYAAADLPLLETRSYGKRSPGGKKSRAASSRQEKGEALSPQALADAFVDPALLPPGELRVYSSTVHFLPEQARRLLPPDFIWKGFPLGRLQQNGKVRVSPYLRVLMPPCATARQNGLPVINLEETQPLVALLNGQSLPVDCRGNAVGLYFRDLPLCRPAVKGKRAVLPPA